MPETPTFHPPRASARVKRGARALTDACRPTLGPRAHPVLVKRRSGQSLVSHDGATLRGEMELTDPVERLGAQVIREAADRTTDAVGDGSTTANLLAYSLFAGGLERLAAGVDIGELKMGLRRGMNRAVEVLESLSEPVTSPERALQVATLAAEGDARMGQLAADALRKVGPEGTVTVEEVPDGEAGVRTVGGVRFRGGHLSPYFVTDPRTKSAVHSNARVLVCAGRVASITPLLPAMEQVAREGSPFLLVADEVTEDVLATLVVHELRGTLSCLAVRGPVSRDGDGGVMGDLAALTGARLVERNLTADAESVPLSDLGGTDRVRSTGTRTEVLGGWGSEEAVEQRCKELRRNGALSASRQARDDAQDLLANLSGGMAVVRVVSEPGDMEGSRMRALRRALGATKAALEEGVVPGGGTALIRVIPSLEAEAEGAPAGEEAGLRVVVRSLEAPAVQIAENAGLDGTAVTGRVAAGEGSMGFDAARRRYVNLMDEGIVDPTKVVRTALENAAAVAETLLLANASLSRSATAQSVPPRLEVHSSPRRSRRPAGRPVS